MHRKNNRILPCGGQTTRLVLVPLVTGRNSLLSFLTSELTATLVPPEMAFLLCPKVVVTLVISLYMLKAGHRMRSTRDHFLPPSGSLA